MGSAKRRVALNALFLKLLAPLTLKDDLRMYRRCTAADQEKCACTLVGHAGSSEVFLSASTIMGGNDSRCIKQVGLGDDATVTE